jgi:hypothetical protein
MEIARTFEHTGYQLQISAAEIAFDVDPIADSTAPGSGPISVVGLALSSTQLAPGESLTVSAQVNGETIAFIFLELYLRDTELGLCFGPLMHLFIPSPVERTIQGKISPQWDANNDVSLQLTPTLMLLTDGAQAALACLRCTEYSMQDYELDGETTPCGETFTRRARLTFDHAGDLASTLVYKKSGRRMLPHEHAFSAGDTFRPHIDILPDLANGIPQQNARGYANMLRCQSQPFTLVEAPLIPGEYLLALGVEDLDGEQTRFFAPFSFHSGSTEPV